MPLALGPPPGTVIRRLSSAFVAAISVPGSRRERQLHGLSEARPGGAVSYAPREGGDRQLPESPLPTQPVCPPQQQDLLSQLRALLLR